MNFLKVWKTNMKNTNIPKIVTLLDLIKIVEWSDIIRILLAHYPQGNKELEKHAFNIISRIKKIPNKFKTEFIHINLILPFLPSEKYLTAKEDRTHNHYSVSTNKFSLSFRPWIDVANMPIAYKTLTSYSIEDIVAHILWEITFYGDEEKMKQIAEETNKSMEECIKQLKK